MKIYLCFLQGKPGHPIPSYQFWEYYIKNGIEEGGDEWVENDVDWAFGLVPQSKESYANWKSLAWEKTIKSIKESRPDIFLSYLYPHQVDSSAIRLIKDMGIPTVNFFCDNVREFQRIPSSYQEFSLHWVPEYKALKMYKDRGFKYLNLPMPMWVEPKRRANVSKEIPVVTFIGSRDIQRQLLFEQVVASKFNFQLEIYGAAWSSESEEQKNELSLSTSVSKKLLNQVNFIKKNGVTGFYRKIRQMKAEPQISMRLQDFIKGRPSFDEYVKLTSSSLVTLGINRYPSFKFPLNQPNTYSRLRDIEAPMLGACYLTEWTEGLDSYYDIGAEIETYKSIHELIGKTEMLVKDSMKRSQLRVKGQRRALEELSIPKSIEKIKNVLLTK